MKTSKLKISGAVLLLCVALAGIGLQLMGPGLVTTRPRQPPQAGTTSQGVPVTVTARGGLVFHLKTIVPLAALAGVGLLCIASARRHDTESPQ
ncbi:MAG TPA: hypothetical protein P5186_12160 [Candidatus Paceibacterota bacterium]|nr:hypothetical protein [Verrucomicrobiota bacterium]HRY48794.1 hypothetical protein [Candidatus Paceibacterota bacterium]HRZ99480.1 hypothetical protein [Candidatus Paceibacterota bacterium]